MMDCVRSVLVRRLMQWLDKAHVWPSVQDESDPRATQRHRWYLATRRDWECRYGLHRMFKAGLCDKCPRSVVYYLAMSLTLNAQRSARDKARDPARQERSTFNRDPIVHMWVWFMRVSKYRLSNAIMTFITMVAAIAAVIIAIVNQQ